MNYTDDSDESLMARHARGDGAAFELLYRRHEVRTWRYLERNVGSHAIADGLMQDVWFIVARDAAGYEPQGGRFATWLFSIAHQKLNEHAKASRTQPNAPSPAPEQLAPITQVLAQLPREQRDSYLLQLEGELTVEEISAVTNSAVEMTQARLHYARTKLGELLAEPK
jgi:RNA polymerase sigma-70 factor, ECF subfamily